MCEALRELMKEDLEAARASGEEAGKKIGTEIGKEIGTEIGKAQARKELILNSLKNNRTAEEVSEFLSIPLDEVKAVEKQIEMSNV